MEIRTSLEEMNNKALNKMGSRTSLCSCLFGPRWLAFRNESSVVVEVAVIVCLIIAYF